MDGVISNAASGNEGRNAFIEDNRLAVKALNNGVRGRCDRNVVSRVLGKSCGEQIGFFSASELEAIR